MTKWIESMMKRTFLAVTFMILIVVWGSFSVYRIHRDYLPPISNPTLMVSVTANGFRSAEVEAFLAKPLGQAVRTVSGVESVETNSFDGGLYIHLDFASGTSMDRMESDVSRAIQTVVLPSGSERPVITRISSSSLPVMRICLSGTPDRVNEEALRTVVQEQVANDLRSLQGTSDIQVTGAGTNGYTVTIRTDDLQAAGLTMEEVKEELSKALPGEAWGTIMGGTDSQSVLVKGWDLQEQDVKNYPIQGRNGRKVPLSSIADVTHNTIGLQTISRTDGKPSVVFDILKTPSANITEYTGRVRERIESMLKVLPEGVKLDILFDKGEQVRSALNDLLKEGLFGCLFSVLSVFLFFRRVQSTLLVALSLPVCLLATIGLLDTMGFSLNILTVSGLIVAMGRVIDDSIVIIDNMHRRSEEAGDSAKLSTLAGAVREMLPAVVSSTVTTVAVYVPITLAGGMISSAFTGFAWSVVAALLTSLAVSILVVPALYRLRKPKGAYAPSSRKIEEAAKNVLERVFRHPRKLCAILCILLAVAIAGAVNLPVNVMPSAQTGQIAVQVEMPENTTLAEMDAVVKRLEKAIAEVPEIQRYASTSGVSGAPQFDDVFDASGAWIQEGSIANISLNLKQGADPDSMVLKLKKVLYAVSGNAVCTVTNQNISGDDSQLKIDLTGADSVTLGMTAQLIRSKLQMIPSLNVAGTSNLKASNPGFQIVLNRDAIEQAGVNPGDIFARMRGYFAPVTKMELRVSTTERIPIELKTDLLNGPAGHNSQSFGQAADMRLLSKLGNETFEGKEGAKYRLDQLVTVEPAADRTVLRNREGRPFDVVTANITSRDIERVSGEVEAQLKQLPLAPGVRYSINGISAQADEMIQGIARALAVAILLVLLIISCFFRGWRAPSAVLICIPFAYIGGIIGMMLFGKEWDMAAMIGFLMLSGIVVTNGIVLVDKIERNLRSGMPQEEAIMHGTISRVRPVLMTAITTILTLLPICIFGGRDAIVSQTLGLVVVSGMVSSTFSSLAFIPLTYKLLQRRPSVTSDF
ncbi:efflux RND transporter permease subunit [Paenibacillus sp. GCM10027628]|uniref:efflux RND transporter permease subunit n=1 Tax=Paenibacillus sp. GCM10027628 TaxID=3273413 RepID=UPI003625C9E0